MTGYDGRSVERKKTSTAGKVVRAVVNASTVGENSKRYLYQFTIAQPAEGVARDDPTN